MILKDKIELTRENTNEIIEMLNGLLKERKNCVIYNSHTDDSSIKCCNVLCGDYAYYRNSKTQCLVYNRYVYGVEIGQYDRVVIHTYSIENDMNDCEIMELGDTLGVRFGVRDGKTTVLVEIAHNSGRRKGKVWISLD